MRVDKQFAPMIIPPMVIRINSLLLELTIKSPKVRTNSIFLKESPVFATSNTYVNDLKIKLGREVILLYLETTKL